MLSAGGGREGWSGLAGWENLTCCWWRKAGSLGLRPTKRFAVGVPGAE